MENKCNTQAQPMENPVMEAILTRRSVRNFKEEPVPKECLAALAKAAIYAPSGRGLQTWQITVVDRRDPVSYTHLINYPLENRLSIYKQESEIIREMAEKSDCVIVGRCADYILQDLNPFRLFVYCLLYTSRCV